jgi:hypothetical protein
MYRNYEQIVLWVREAAIMANWRFDNDTRITDWRELDGKLLDHLRGLVALPTLASTSLHSVFEEIDQGGAAKLVRRELAKQDAHYSDGT